MFNVSDLLVAEEIGFEVARQVPKFKPERKNDVYFIAEVPLNVSHDCHSIDIPTFFDVVAFAKIAPCSSAYKYRINHGKWIDVGQNVEIVERDFDIDTIDVSNDVGTGILSIYLEGVHAFGS